MFRIQISRRGRSGTPKNYGYRPDPAHADARAAESRKLYGADPFEHLKADLNTSAFPSRCAAWLLSSNPNYVSVVNGTPVLKARNQSSHGSCVGHGEARKILISLAAGLFFRGWRLDETAIRNDNGLPCDVSPSFCYGASREWDRGRWEGSNGSWAAKATQELGFLFERYYGGFRSVANYSTSNCDSWEQYGVPREALEYSKQNRLAGYARVDNWEQLAKASHHGYAANICGSHAPGSETRDEFGALALTGTWAHSQCSANYVTYSLGGGAYRRYFEIWNSHGVNRYNGGTGPKTPDLARGAYLVSVKDMQRILDERDTWINFDQNGLEPKAKNWRELARRTFGKLGNVPVPV